MPPVNAFEGTLIFQVFRLRNSIETIIEKVLLLICYVVKTPVIAILPTEYEIDKSNLGTGSNIP